MSHPLRGFDLRDIPATRRLFCWACACYSCWPFKAASRRFPQLRIGSFCRDLSHEIVLLGNNHLSPRKLWPLANSKPLGLCSKLDVRARPGPTRHRSREGGRHSFAGGATRIVAVSLNRLETRLHFPTSLLLPLGFESGLVLQSSAGSPFFSRTARGPSGFTHLPSPKLLAEELEH